LALVVWGEHVADRVVSSVAVEHGWFAKHCVNCYSETVASDFVDLTIPHVGP